MDVGDRIRAHLRTELGPAYKDLAAAAERDNATRASDKALFYILLITFIVTGALVLYRLWLHTKVRRETLQKLEERTIPKDGFRDSGTTIRDK
uniref:Wsv293a-like protein n=1 Tax=Metapenaeus ensis nimavirus TaxID=2133794 RepID=A0A401IPE6_9VIRU|nr:MAG: wsv293a-like protein [Metapenaeus ensis nimavirus]GBG35471.1 wsv293a-like protein [Metapenaeus ensis nimavirus]